ncbi:class I SAM-dependent methyltransferase [Streptomyces sp. AJS327]|uniref:class I SAM-dependent methyltransferase n=1 Tax=Streptomyces sp. AJS327 TaxID=2545265 RepID=UPI0027E59229|nr:class I SAM-dependent methyltransferase [Streptomyces sp. AJS327]
MLARLGPRRGLAIDLGCGVGSWTRILANWQFETVGLDWAPQAIASARRASPHLSYALHDFTRPDIDAIPGTAKADLITARLTLHVLPRPHSIMAWARTRWLRPGGRFHLMVPITADRTDRTGFTERELMVLCDGWKVLDRWYLAGHRDTKTACLLLAPEKLM